jgi:phosphatidylglycerophosphate synthase
METLRREALFHLGFAGAVLAMVAATLEGSAALAVALFAAIALLVWRGLRAHPHGTFGPANAITVLRAAITAALAGLLLSEPIPAGIAAAAGGLALLLDGVDGRLARRTGLASPFGARFDMEVDALLVLVLAGLVLACGKAGPWVLAIGLLRYLWVAAALLWPPLGRDLPPSGRRRFLCGFAVASLVFAVAAPAWLASPLCAAALGGLMYSFGTDLCRLLGQGLGTRV